MEAPILLAMDTTENWERSSTVLGESELAIEVREQPDGTKTKHLMIGDGKPVGPGMGRLRPKPDFASETLLEEIEKFVEANTLSEVSHDDTLAGTGREGDPLTVAFKYDLTVGGLTASAEFTADGEKKTFNLPDDFAFLEIVLIAINGLWQSKGDYDLDKEAGKLTFFETPEKGDVVTIAYTAKR